MYSFAKPEAVRSFREAWKRDPNCAICYWGEAWAWGSYLNGPMSAEQSPFAYAAAKKAQALRARLALTAEKIDTGELDAVGLYFQQVGRVPLLKPAQERALCERIERAQQALAINVGRLDGADGEEVVRVRGRRLRILHEAERHAVVLQPGEQLAGSQRIVVPVGGVMLLPGTGVNQVVFGTHADKEAVQSESDPVPPVGGHPFLPLSLGNLSKHHPAVHLHGPVGDNVQLCSTKHGRSPKMGDGRPNDKATSAASRKARAGSAAGDYPDIGLCSW